MADENPVEATVTETVSTPEGDAKRSETWTLSREEWDRLVSSTEANQRKMLDHLERMDRETEPASPSPAAGDSEESSNRPTSATSSPAPSESGQLPELTIEAPAVDGTGESSTGTSEDAAAPSSSKSKRRRRKRLWAT